jgi:hypothetical protein
MKRARRIISLLAVALLLVCPWEGAAQGDMPGGNTLWFNPPEQGAPRVTLHFFWSNRCPHCLEARPFVKALQARYPWLEVASYEVNDDLESRSRFIDMAALLGQQPASVPTFMHGMQAEERFDLNPAKGFDPDYDEDGMARELTIGDQTAISIWQAQLSTPVQVMPYKLEDRKMVKHGEQVFQDLECTSCHVPALTLNSRLFVEPNPFNPPGTCNNLAPDYEGLCPPVSFDMTKEGDKPRLEKGPNGTAVVRAYTDLKRHNLCDDVSDPDPIRFFCNEQLSQGRPDQDGKPGTEFFLTRKLWDVGNTAPYGHRGDISTITEAILFHGGEGRASRDAFAGASVADQKALVAFLKSLQIVPQK